MLETNSQKWLYVERPVLPSSISHFQTRCVMQFKKDCLIFRTLSWVKFVMSFGSIWYENSSNMHTFRDLILPLL